MTRSLRFATSALELLGFLTVGASVWAQPGPSGGMRGGGQGDLLSMEYAHLLAAPTVQKELKLTDDQKAKLKEASDKTRSATIGLLSGVPGLSQEDRQARMADFGKKMQKSMADELKSMQSTLRPEQFKRLREIAIQTAGAVMALSDKAVQRDLKLSGDQIAKINSINRETAEKMRELSKSVGDRQARSIMVQELGKDMEKKFMDVLDADQFLSLEKMKGEKLEIPRWELQRVGGRDGGPDRAGAPGGAH